MSFPRWCQLGGTIVALGLAGVMAAEPSPRATVSHGAFGDDVRELAGVNWMMVATAVSSSVVFAGAGMFVWVRRGKPTATPAEAVPQLADSDVRPRDVEGWLIIAGIWLCAWLIPDIENIGDTWSGFFSLEVWQARTTPEGASYHPQWAAFTIYQLVGYLAGLALNLLAVGLFFSKRRTFPRVFVIMVWYHAVYLAGDRLLRVFYSMEDIALKYPKTEDVQWVVCVAVFWTVYVLRSKRARETFVR